MRYFILFLLIGMLSIESKAQEIYPFELENTNGELVSYEEIKGNKVTIIDFWATWCKPCVNSIPKLVGIYESFDSEEVAFIGISIDSPRNLAKVKPFVESKGVTYPILLDMNQELMREYNVTSIPTLLIVNADNEIVSIHEGFAPGDEDKLVEEINALLYE